MTDYYPVKSKTAAEESEPADPDCIDHQIRRNKQIAPSHYVGRLPDPLFECGCGNCPEVADPLASTNSGLEDDYYAGTHCESPVPVTVERAASIYQAYVLARIARKGRTSKYERNLRKTYPQILAADRSFRSEYDLTTVMLTRRVSPKDDNGEFFSPLLLNKALLSSTVRSKVMRKIRTHINSSDWEYVRVVAGTESAATPHEHIYLWIDDPDDNVGFDEFIPALDAHLEYSPLANPEHHPYGKNRDTGAIRICHDPPLADNALTQRDEIDQANTRGALYVATQLPHLFVGQARSGVQGTPKQTLIDTGAIAWASPNKWFTSSQGVSSPDGL